MNATHLLTALALTLGLAVAPVHAGDDVSLEELAVFSNYLEFMESWKSWVSDPAMAVLLAQEGVKDLYEAKGRLAEAAPVLEEILAEAERQDVRNILRFGLKDLYEKTDDHAKALEHLKAVMRENRGTATKR